MGLLALAIVPALILEDATNPAIRRAAEVTNWVVWVAFCAEYVAKLVFASRRVEYVRRAWFDLAIILVSPPFLVPQNFEFLRSLRAVRLLRLLRLVRAFGIAMVGLRFTRRALGRRQFHYVIVVAVVIVGMGAIAIFVAERGTSTTIVTLGDALWWAIVTATTVGYGDISPTTWEGRVIAVVLMLVGIAVIGAFTASLAGLFFEQEKSSELARIEARLDQIEAKLDQLTRRLP
jgi:voltage-gated potassium channel